MTAEKASTGNSALDDLMGGGLERKVLTQIFGEPASGKSTLCIMAAVNCLKSGKGVIFMDSEGFSIERFRQVAGADAQDLARDLYLFEPEDFDQQGAMIGRMETVLKGGQIGLIVMDSATGLYRTRLDKGKEAMQKLTRQVIHLLGYAKRYQIPVLITNQVYMDLKKNMFAGLGGTALEHISKVILRTERLNSHRRCTLVKHRSRPGGTSFDFIMVDRGIQTIP
ncbi:MAG TPA: DNA repair and recombination protein RadB [Methanoregulaceae archaeon]|nr:DNA repair and recombination protein RadB [Methanoregulaceae archaeon]